MDKTTKYIIVGFHASGKGEIVKDLVDNGIRVGRNFTSLSEVSDVYLSNTTNYSRQDIDTIFESQAYLFLQKNFVGGSPYYEGLSLYEYDNNDVFVLLPDQFNLIPSLPKDVVIIWLDNTSSDRRMRHIAERRKYDFVLEENKEKQDIIEFVDKLNNGDNKLLYFNNEDPMRVSAIIYALVNHPELLDIFERRFNN